jgi:hypothetical protein
MGRTNSAHCASVSRVLSATVPELTAASDTVQPKRLPRALTAIGQLKWVSVIMCLLAFRVQESGLRVQS